MRLCHDHDIAYETSSCPLYDMEDEVDETTKRALELEDLIEKREETIESMQAYIIELEEQIEKQTE